jgi:hypothetical protein
MLDSVRSAIIAVTFQVNARPKVGALTLILYHFL